MATFQAFLIILCLVALGLGSDPNEFELRVLGGTKPYHNGFPYMAALLNAGHQFCGGTLITYNTIVTAAHCIDDRNIDQLSVRLGSLQWYSGGQEISVKHIIIHEMFNSNTMEYDVAILKLSESVNSINAIPIPLAPAGREYPPGTIGVVTGWGHTIPGIPSAVETLRYVEVPIFEHSKCQWAYYGRQYITSRHICAGFKEGGKDSCQRDSGGPYVINGELAGIVSFGQGCGDPRYPGVYSSIPALGDWIRRHAGM